MLSIIKLRYFFLLALLIRFIFLICSNIIKLEPTSCCDWSRYNQISDNIINGNFNLDAGPFVIAPIFPYFVSLIKLINYDNHVIIILLTQIFLSALSVIYLIKISENIFNNKSISYISGLIYCLYPITFWYTIFLGQETIFQFFFIVSIYYLTSYLKDDKFKNLIKFSLFFCLSFLTKSHVLIFFPFVFLIFIFKNRNTVKSIKDFLVFIIIIFFVALPHGLSNKIMNGFYVLSTTGLGTHFLVGHNDDFYKMVTNPPPKNSEEYKRIWSMNYKVLVKIENDFRNESHVTKDRKRLIEGINWIKDNPKKSINLIYINSVNYLKPGFNKLHQDYLKWLVSLIISLPIFIFGYLGIINNLYNNFKNHTPILSIFLTMFLFSVIFYSQNRFRVITVEPFYIIYASYFLHYINEKYLKLFLNNKT